MVIDKQRWQALSPLLDELLDSESAERAARLAKIQGEDAVLGATLAALLARHARVETANFLEGSVLSGQEMGDLSGQVVGNYTLERPIEQGGMGSVWLARRSDGRYEGQVAVKFLNLSLMGSDGLARFQREGSALARLTHPCIARLLDAGLFSGQPFLVLEYIEGQRIDRYCDGQRLAVDARVRLFLDVHAAVEHAHRNLILHCDLKPGNILVTRDGAVKLLDFGIATLMRDETRPASDVDLAPAGMQPFTPEYAAPEQLSGGDLTTATDVYALGVLLHVLLTGSHPVAAALASAKVPALRGDLDSILAKALKKNPAERYPTASEFAADLRRYLNHEPVAARAGSFAYRTRKFVRRHRLAVGSALVTLLALVAGVVGTTWQAIEARRAQARAEANAAEARRQKEAAEYETRVARANHEFVSQIFGDAMRGGESERMQKRLDRAYVMLQRRYQDDPEVLAILLLQLSARYEEIHDNKREAQVMREFEAIAQRTGKPGLLAEMNCIRAYELMRQRKIDEAAPFLREGLAYSKQANKPLDDLECVRADAMMAAHRGDPVRAQQLMKDFLVVLERGGRGKSRAYLVTLGSLAFVQILSDDPVAALATTQHAIALDESLGSADTFSTLVDVDRVAALQIELGRFADADATDRDLMRRFAEAEEQMPGFQADLVGRRAMLNGKAEESIDLLRTSLKHFETEGPEGSMRTVMVDMVDAYLLAGKLDQADVLLRRYESLIAKQPPGSKRKMQVSRFNALLASQRRQLAAARSHAAALTAVLDSASDLRRMDLLRGRLDAGWVLLNVGDLEGAQRQGELAFAVAKEKTLNGQPSAWVGGAALLLAEVYAARNDQQRAQKNLALAREQLTGSVAAGHRVHRMLGNHGVSRPF